MHPFRLTAEWGRGHVQFDSRGSMNAPNTLNEFFIPDILMTPLLFLKINPIINFFWITGTVRIKT